MCVNYFSVVNILVIKTHIYFSFTCIQNCSNFDLIIFFEKYWKVTSFQICIWRLNKKTPAEVQQMILFFSILLLKFLLERNVKFKQISEYAVILIIFFLIFILIYWTCAYIVKYKIMRHTL